MTVHKVLADASRAKSCHQRPLAIVLGATGGIGGAFCDELADRGFDLILTGRSRESLQRKQIELNAGRALSVQTMVIDLCLRQDVERVKRELVDNERLTWLINATGIVRWNKFEDVTVEDEAKMFHVNVLTPMELTHAAVSALSSRGGGTIIHVASVGAFVSLPYLASYCATKAALLQFMTSVHQELRRRERRGQKIHLQTLCPGFVRTGVFEKVGIQVERLPRWILLSPQRVVRESLWAAARKRAVCVPSLRYRLIVTILKFAPTSISRRVTAWLFGDFEKYGRC